MAAMAIGLAAYAGTTAAGYSAYAALAYTVASTATNMLLAKDTNISQEGRRLDDLKVQLSTIGAYIPQLWGTTRGAGNVFWKTDIKETPKVERHSSGGKGAKQNVTTTTYTYSVNLAIILAGNKTSALSRIWADGDLEGDNTLNNSGYIGDIDAKIRFYNGTQTEPDPLIESIEGHAPSYEDYSYVVFEDLQLEKYGNRIPNFTFEVINSDNTVEYIKVEDIVVYENYNNATIQKTAYDINTKCNIIFTENKLIKYNVFSNQVENEKDLFLNRFNDNSFSFVNNDIIFGSRLSSSQINIINPSNLSTKTVITAENLGIEYNFSPPQLYNIYKNTVCSFTLSSVRDFIYKLSFNKNYSNANTLKINNPFYNNPLYSNRKMTILDDQSQNSRNQRNCYDDKYFYFYSYQNKNNDFLAEKERLLALNRINLENNILDREYKIIFKDLKENNVRVDLMFFDSVSRCIFTIYNDLNESNINKYYLIKMNVDTNEIISKIEINNSYALQYLYSINDRKLCYYYLRNDSETVRVNYDLDTLEYIEYYDESYGLHTMIGKDTLSYIDGMDTILCVYQKEINKLDLFKDFGKRVKGDSYSLDKIVKEISLSSGLREEFIDVSELSGDKVKGFQITRMSSIRSNIEQLMIAFDFEQCESDWQIKYIKKKNPVATINVSDLNADKYSENQVFDSNIITVNSSELELPQTLNLTYSSINRDFEQNTQDCRRYTVDTQEVKDITIAVVLDDDEAKNIVYNKMYATYVNRYEYSFNSSYEQVELEVNDIVNLTGKNKNGEDFTYVARILQIQKDAGLIKYKAVSEDTAVYTQNEKGDSGNFKQQEVDVFSNTTTEFLDIPILRNEDDSAGFYVAAYPSSKSLKWTGSTLFASLEENSSFIDIASFFNSSIVGFTTTKLNNIDENYYYQIDYMNSVIVKINTGSLENTTLDKFLSGYNIALIGNELISFKNATLIADNTYKLTTLLRGKYNTEDEINNHSINDRFILINSNYIQRINNDSAQLFVNRYFKNITFKTTNTNTVEFTNNGIGLRCYNVDDVQVNMTHNQDRLISWKPRVRGNGFLRDYLDVEDLDFDDYSIDVLDDNNNIVRTININNSRNYIYTYEQQVSDFGSIKDSVKINIYKINKIIGRGKVKQAII